MAIFIFLHGGPYDGQKVLVEKAPGRSLLYFGKLYVWDRPNSIDYYFQEPIPVDVPRAWHGLMRTLAHSMPQALRRSAAARWRIKRLLR